MGGQVMPGFQDLAKELHAAGDDVVAQAAVRQHAEDAGVPWQTVAAAAWGLAQDASAPEGEKP